MSWFKKEKSKEVTPSDNKYVNYYKDVARDIDVVNKDKIQIIIDSLNFDFELYEKLDTSTNIWNIKIEKYSIEMTKNNLKLSITHEDKNIIDDFKIKHIEYKIYKGYSSSIQTIDSKFYPDFQEIIFKYYIVTRTSKLKIIREEELIILKNIQDEVGLAVLRDDKINKFFKMRYVVWLNPYKSYNIAQGNGYYQSYKDKLSDKFTSNPIDAKKYTNIGSALNKMRFRIDTTMKTVDDVLKSNGVLGKYKMNQIISNIINDENDDIVLVFENGYIEIIDDSGKIVGIASNEILKYIENKLGLNDKNIKRKNDMFNRLGVGSIDNSDADEFWKNILK